MSDLEREATLRCDTCNAAVYYVFRRQVREPDGQPRIAREHVLWPAHPDVPPPARTDKISCPTCGAVLRRVAS